MDVTPLPHDESAELDVSVEQRPDRFVNVVSPGASDDDREGSSIFEELRSGSATSHVPLHDAILMHVNLNDVSVDLPPAVERLHGALVQARPTAGDGACSIHSLWGV